MDRDAGASTRFSSKVKLPPRLRLKWRSPPQRRKDECVMKRKFLLARFFVGTLFALLMCDSACNARAEEVKDFGREQLNNSPRHGEWVDFKSGERTIKAFIVYPERKDKAPVVLVVHEIFGVTDWVRGVCDQLAESGVIAIVPDLLSGQTFSDADGARKAISALPKDQVKADLDAASNYTLEKIPSANGTLAVCGFCWGGGWAFGYAAVNPKL